MPLTDTECRNAKCPEGRAYVRLSDSGGLYLEVTAPGPKNPAGSKLWRWKYRYAGKEKRLSLGVYPAVPLASRNDAPKGPGKHAPNDGGMAGACEGGTPTARRGAGAAVIGH